MQYEKEETVHLMRTGSLNIAQQQIGAGQRAFTGGLWPLAWRTAQQDYYTRIRSKKSAAVWMSQTIIKIQAVLYEMWHRRNKALHGDEDSEVNKLRHEELNQAIDEIYDEKPHDRLLPHADVEYFRKQTKLQAKKKKLISKEDWVKVAQIILRTYEGLMNRGGRITDYFYIQRHHDG